MLAVAKRLYEYACVRVVGLFKAQRWDLWEKTDTLTCETEAKEPGLQAISGFVKMEAMFKSGMARLQKAVAEGEKISLPWVVLGEKFGIVGSWTWVTTVCWNDSRFAS